MGDECGKDIGYSRTLSRGKDKKYFLISRPVLFHLGVLIPHPSSLIPPSDNEQSTMNHEQQGQKVRKVTKRSITISRFWNQLYCPPTSRLKSTCSDCIARRLASISCSARSCTIGSWRILLTIPRVRASMTS